MLSYVVHDDAVCLISMSILTSFSVSTSVVFDDSKDRYLFLFLEKKEKEVTDKTITRQDKTITIYKTTARKIKTQIRQAKDMYKDKSKDKD
jgi:hypothetical protein